MDNKKIVLMTHEYPPKRGGAGRYCEELVHASSKLGYSIEAWVPRYASPKNDPKIKPHLGETQSWVSSYKLFEKIKRNQNNFDPPNLLHIAESGCLRGMIRFGWLLKSLPALILTIHGTELIRFSRNPLEKALFKSLLKRANRIHVLSKFNQTELLKMLPNIKNQILVRPPAPARNLSGIESSHIKKKGASVKILCVARIHPRKGQDRLLEAIRALPTEKKQNLECAFIGPTVTKDFFEDLQKRSKNIGCKVSFYGDLSDKELNIHYQNSDFLALTSMPRNKSVEGFGIVCAEASSYGLPVLAHRIGGLEDAVLHGQTGFLTDPHRPKELEKYLFELVTNQALRKRLGDAGKKWAKSLSWEALALALYNSD